MRVTSGNNKGRRLKTRTGNQTRPTSDRVRAAIFDILPLDISGAVVLDLYSGSGAMGIEALSRGAGQALFVDSSRDSIRVIRENLELMGLGDRCRLMNKRAAPALRLLGAEGSRFDLVFLDPPYPSGEAKKALELLAGLDVLTDEAIVVAEHDVDHELGASFGPLARVARREYGRTVISFYEKRGKA
ncbi:MAG TPA: 16S rRNA (guanine(966)-N(2))-methyltransferase RsmD [bacterium]|nr:16S rRNA (guanine(966)-N(2))-methyltransferase RsmD [bacterium]